MGEGGSCSGVACLYSFLFSGMVLCLRFWLHACFFFFCVCGTSSTVVQYCSKSGALVSCAVSVFSIFFVCVCVCLGRDKRCHRCGGMRAVSFGCCSWEGHKYFPASCGANVATMTAWRLPYYSSHPIPPQSHVQYFLFYAFFFLVPEGRRTTGRKLYVQ